MEYRILGPLEVVDGGRELSLGGARQRALLAVLLLHANEAVSTDRLVEELWGASPPESGPKALQVAVSQLRKTLQPVAGVDGRIVTRAPGYVLRVEEGELDRDRFEALVEQARGESDAAARAAKLRQALALWRGEPLADLAYEAFAQPAIAHLEAERLAALEQRVDADLEAGRDADLVGELEALVARYPLRERLRGQLMLALYRSGRQADALDVYQDTRRTLVDELGVEPGPELQQLQKAVLDHDPALGGVRTRRMHSAPEEAPARGRRAGLLAVLGLLVLAAVVAAFLLTRGDDSRPVVVPPDAVAVIDPGSNEVVDAISVGNSPGPIAVWDKWAWVVNRNDATVSGIDLTDRDVWTTSGTNGGNSPSIAIQGDGSAVWLGTVESTEIEAVFYQGAGEVATLNIGDPTISGVGALAFDEDTLLIADTSGALLRADVDVSPGIASSMPLSHKPVALAVGEGYAWVANQGRTVSRVDLRTGQVAEVRVGDRPTAVAGR